MSRAFKLNRLFQSVLEGTVGITQQNYTLFLEAVSFQANPAICLAKLVPSKSGLASLQTAIRCDLTAQFFNRVASKLLSYLQSPSLQKFPDDESLRQVILAMADTPLFWNALWATFERGELDPETQMGFLWLLLQLVKCDRKNALPIIDQIEQSGLLRRLGNSSAPGVRARIEEIKQAMQSHATPVIASPSTSIFASPGGRHTNDHPNIRDISILPTADEIRSAQLPFLRASSSLDSETGDRFPLHIDNQFRLLREDFIHELREVSETVLKKKKGHRLGLKLKKLQLLKLYYGVHPKRRTKWGLAFQCTEGLPGLPRELDERRKFLQENHTYWRYGSLACICIDNEIMAFALVMRDEDLLTRETPVVVLQLDGKENVVQLLQALKRSQEVSLFQVDVAYFAYEPVLRALQRLAPCPVSQDLLCYTTRRLSATRFSSTLSDIIQSLQSHSDIDLQPLLCTPKPVKLDKSQTQSLLAGLTQQVTLIQGPPGTGKSFIGSLLAKILHDTTDLRILVVCYTNHALDDVLIGLMDVGIPENDIVRLGGGKKTNPRTEQLSLSKQPRGQYKRNRGDWAIIELLQGAVNDNMNKLDVAFQAYAPNKLKDEDIMGYLEFEHPDYFSALKVPENSDQMETVARGRVVRPTYLLDRWRTGKDAGVYKAWSRVRDSQIWHLQHQRRLDLLGEWKDALTADAVQQMAEMGEEYNTSVDKLSHRNNDTDIATLCSKRIIGCTTTGAAKYAKAIQASLPDVVLVEEAGEILESHVLTSLGSRTEQLILIGDHKQLRPKVNNYRLTVEKGEGFDLNVSLFERMILKGYPHSILQQQHRMRPEISSFIRHLTYPELIDAPSTANRPDLRGVRDNIVFIHHGYLEDSLPNVPDRKDFTSPSSKKNTHESDMVWKIIRYLGQQGYRTEQLVVLTPYLGQLSNLRHTLQKENDPILNDLDAHDLVQAGLMTAASAKLGKKPIRLATIDNYQGEESDIVVVSLTRSNPENDIGFMSSPERLNVLLSRARNALIMVGNANTFVNSRKGKELWPTFVDQLRAGGHLYDGLPVQCERHPGRQATLSTPSEFDTHCPEGGCQEPCGTKLACGIHDCPSKCHQISDHSKMKCQAIMGSKCTNNHPINWKCFEGPHPPCSRCEQEDRLRQKKLKEDYARQQQRDGDIAAHNQQLQDLDDQIAREQQRQIDHRKAQERVQVLQHKNHDLQAAKARTVELSRTPTTNTGVIRQPRGPGAGGFGRKRDSIVGTSNGQVPNTTRVGAVGPLPPSVNETENARSPTSKPETSDPPASTVGVKPQQSPSQRQWERQKEIEGAHNDAMDKIMSLTALEEVKATMLQIKVKIDVARRQDKDLGSERFNTAFLGNPGTGKTTVARQYAKFLSSAGVLPGNEFVETTGSRLANSGVDGAEKLLEQILSSGGGAIFIDEAYQLTSQTSFQGRQVLDYLLAEMENKVGKIVFLLAGYSRQMESFFEHNPGIPSRVPHRFRFEDYTDAELLAMFTSLINRKWSGRMLVESGNAGLYSRVVIARLGRQRGREGFGNARDLENLLDRISSRQATRVSKARDAGSRPDDFYLTKEDMLGPEPTLALAGNPSYERLMKMTGLGSVKQSLKDMMDMIQTNYWRELEEKQPLQVSLNRVFLGPPGTGKTTVAKLFGQILADLGLLSNGEVVIKNPADFIGAHLGESEAKTKAILSASIGKVLVIDEAYMLYSSSSASGNGNHTDSFKTAVIDTIVAEVQSVPGEDRCVLLLGYKPEMETMFQNVNPGLSRRFNIENAFVFEDFSDGELLEILNRKLDDQNLDATEDAKTTVIGLLSRLKARPNFGNAGEIENQLTLAKQRHQGRSSTLPPKERAQVQFLPQDFDPDYDRGTRALEDQSVQKLFDGMVGCKDIIQRLVEYQKLAVELKRRGLDMREYIPTNFVFKGPPGTGKTTVARKFGHIYYDMGFLASAEVIECAASDLVGQYVGQTGPKTKAMLERALGRVLFVDEAYRLAEGHFAQEAIDELVTLLTQPKFHRKIIVILAGYDHDMDRLLEINAGLRSRFPEHIVFSNMRPEQCLDLLHQQLRKHQIQLPALENTSSNAYKNMQSAIGQLSQQPSWGNARDINTLTREMINQTLLECAGSNMLVLRDSSAMKILMATLAKSPQPSHHQPSSSPKSPEHHFPPMEVQTRSRFAPRQLSTHASSAHNMEANDTPVIPHQGLQNGHPRDPGVSDAIWQELQDAQRKSQDLLREEERRRDATIQKEKEWATKKQELELQIEALKNAQSEKDEKRKQELEKARLLALRERETEARRLMELKEQRLKEAEKQAKLRSMGVCVQGFRWVKQAGGYRCQGGSHYVSDAQLDAQ